MGRGVDGGDVEGELADEPLAVDALGVQGGLEAAAADALGAEGEGGGEGEHEDGGVDGPVLHAACERRRAAKTRAGKKNKPERTGLYKRTRRRVVYASSRGGGGAGQVRGGAAGAGGVFWEE